MRLGVLVVLGWVPGSDLGPLDLTEADLGLALLSHTPVSCDQCRLEVSSVARRGPKGIRRPPAVPRDFNTWLKPFFPVSPVWIWTEAHAPGLRVT